MKVIVRGFGFLVTTVLVWYAIQTIAAESGEVVVLTTINSHAKNQETRLWIVDHAESQWLRSGSDVQSWYQNILERPEVEMLRGTEGRLYAAVPSAEDQDEINRLMLEKYGWAESYIGFFFSRTNAIAIRLDPR